MKRPFSLVSNDPQTVLMFGDCGDEGLYWVEPMRFLWPSEARKLRNVSESRKRGAETRRLNRER